MLFTISGLLFYLQPTMFTKSRTRLPSTRALNQGNRVNRAGLYSVQNFTTEYTEGTEGRVDTNRRHRV